MIPILGYFILVFFVLSSFNMLKKYTKNSMVRSIARQHKLLGMITVLLALTHFVLNLLNSTTNLFGFITLLLLISTGVSGTLFGKSKNKNLYVLHRLLGPLVLVFALIHIFTN